MSEQNLLQELQSELLAADSEGNRVYTDESVRRFYPVMLWWVAETQGNEFLPPAHQELLGRFFVEVGFSPDGSAEQLAANINSYLQEHVPAGLIKAFSRVLTSSNRSNSQGVSQRSLDLIGAVTSDRPQSSERPANAVSVLDAMLASKTK